MDGDLYYPANPLPQDLQDMKSAEPEEIVLRVIEWGHKNYFDLTRGKTEPKRRLHLFCKMAGTATGTENAQRKRKSVKTECPFKIKLTYSSKTSQWKILKPKSDKLEDAHNDTLTLSEFQRLSVAKKVLMTQDTVDIVHRMIKAGNSVPEIRKTISGPDGENIQSYDDIRNLMVEMNGHGAAPEGDNAMKFIQQMEMKGYIVRFDVSPDNKSIKHVFFMHSSAIQEVNARGEVIGIDATYNVNNKAMPLVSIQSVSHLGGRSLMTTPIAYAIVSNESTETYVWIFKMLQKFTRDLEGTVFISDKALSVMKALKNVFPSSTHLLCSWHMMENFKNHLAPMFNSAEHKATCMDAVDSMIKSTTEEEFMDALAIYNEYATDSSKLSFTGSHKFVKTKNDPKPTPVPCFRVLEYFEEHWLPIKEKWAGFLVRQTKNFGVVTTSRVEGSHAALKHNHCLTSRSSLDSCFKEVDKYYKKQAMRQRNAAVDEKMKIDCFIRAEPSMKYLLGKVSAWALDAIYKEVLQVNMSTSVVVASEDCKDCAIVGYKLPCKHTVAHAINLYGGFISLHKVSPRWLLMDCPPDTMMDDSVSYTATKYSRSGGIDNAMFASVLSEVQLLFRDCQTTSDVSKLCEAMRRAGDDFQSQMDHVANARLEYPDIEQVKKIGRPKNERAYLPHRADSNKRKHVSISSDSQQLNAPNEFHLPKPKNKKPNPSSAPSTPKLSSSDTVILDANPLIVDKYLDRRLPRTFIKILDNSGGGDCGFKALAQQMYNEDESKFVDVKMSMLETLRENQDYYSNCFDQDRAFLNYSNMEYILSTDHVWMKTPGCAQIAADAFGRPIAVYPNKGCDYAVTFLPLLPYKHSAKKIKPASSPIPLILHNEGDSHWFTVVYKKSQRGQLIYPTPAKWHKEREWNAMGITDKRHWRHLTFFKEASTVQTDANTALVNSSDDEDEGRNDKTTDV